MVIPGSSSAAMNASPDEKNVVFGSQSVSKASPTPYSDATQVSERIANWTKEFGGDGSPDLCRRFQVFMSIENE